MFSRGQNYHLSSGTHADRNLGGMVTENPGYPVEIVTSKRGVRI